MELKDVQVYKENGLSILIHVIEHFSYHVGQITYATKSMKNLDTLYYPEDLGWYQIYITLKILTRNVNKVGIANQNHSLANINNPINAIREITNMI